MIQNRLSNKICPEDMTVEEWQIALRRENARHAGFTVEHLDNNRIWGDYLVSNGPGRYRVAFRGVQSDRNYCSCLDFRTNGLGTCKHLEAVLLMLQQSVEGYPWAGLQYNPPYSSLYVSYKGGRSIRMRIGSERAESYRGLMERYCTPDGLFPEEKYLLFGQFLEEARAISIDFRCYEDVQDYVEERLRISSWRLELSTTYPEGAIPWDKYTLNPELKDLETLLYKLCYQGYGFLVGRRTPQHPHLIARLTEEIYQGLEHPMTGYIILETESEVAQWRAIFSQYSEIAQLPVRIITQQELTRLATSEHQVCSLAYVDNADLLKEWKHPLSMAVKRLRISHLYMRIDTLTKLTPVGISSIVQHVSPFIIGPFYKFIHTYRPFFPLRDDGSNMPEEMRRFTFLLPQLLSSREVPQADAPTALSTGDSGDALVSQCLDLLSRVLSSPEASRLLATRLQKVLVES